MASVEQTSEDAAVSRLAACENGSNYRQQRMDGSRKSRRAG
jgi:hypothetical protein